MVVANHPQATKAGCDILESGGTAVDARSRSRWCSPGRAPVRPASAAAAFWSITTRRRARSQPTMAARPPRRPPPRTTCAGSATPSPPRRCPTRGRAARSIGTPGIVQLLETAHADAGKLPWKTCLPRRSGSPAMASGSARAWRSRSTSPRRCSSATRGPRLFPRARRPRQAPGHAARQPRARQTFQAIAAGGSAAFYTGAIAQDIVDEVADTTGGITPGAMTLADLAGYRAIKREPVCTISARSRCAACHRRRRGVSPWHRSWASSRRFDLAQHSEPRWTVNGGRPTLEGVPPGQRGRAPGPMPTRDRYVADTDFVPLPGRRHRGAARSGVPPAARQPDPHDPEPRDGLAGRLPHHARRPAAGSKSTARARSPSSTPQAM